MKADRLLRAAAGPHLAAIARVAAELVRHGWAEAGAGNFSLRVRAPGFPGTALALPLDARGLTGQVLLTKRTGARMRDLGRDPLPGLCLVLVTGARTARVYPAGARPSSELPSHLAAHAALLAHRPADRAVLHCHATSLIALSLLVRDRRKLPRVIESMHTEGPVLLHGRVAVLRFLPPGSAELARATAAALRRTPCLVWPAHGALASGPDLDSALDLVELADKAATIALALGERRFRTAGLTAAQQRAARAPRR